MNASDETTAPDWHSAPTGPGHWISRSPTDGEQSWLFTGTTWARCYPNGRRWYGPIVLPPDPKAIGGT